MKNVCNFELIKINKIQKKKYINYDVIQGSAALTKAVRTHVKEYDIFSRVFDNANQLLTNHSPFASLGQVDK